MCLLASSFVLFFSSCVAVFFYYILLVGRFLFAVYFRTAYTFSALPCVAWVCSIYTTERTQYMPIRIGYSSFSCNQTVFKFSSVLFIGEFSKGGLFYSNSKSKIKCAYTSLCNSHKTHDDSNSLILIFTVFIIQYFSPITPLEF